MQSPEAKAAAAVHGISNHEIETSHTFPLVWERFLNFVDRTLTAFVKDDSDSEQEQVGPPCMPDEPPIVLLAAHNGYDLSVVSVCLCLCPRAVLHMKCRTLAFTQVSF